MNAKTKYALMLMLGLAEVYKNGGILSLKAVAEKDHIPVKFLEQIVPALKSGGLIQAHRGSSGGYQLAKAPEKISLNLIFEAVQGGVMTDEKNRNDPSVAHSVMSVVSQEISVRVQNYLESQSLADLTRIYKEKHDLSVYSI